MPQANRRPFLAIVYSTLVTVSTLSPVALSVYDEIRGIALTPTLNTLFDTDELGLRLVALVRNLYFLVFYSLSLVHELRMSTDAAT